MPEEKVEKLPVFPHLTFRELIATMVVTLVLMWISMFFDAPLEELANPSKTPNPAKAPWYFVGLQELLVYFDPWIAGVAIPALIIVGLMAIPFVDRSGGDTKGVPSPTTRPGVFASTVFAIGVIAWFVLIAIGLFFRGPVWRWYWPWESWAVHKPFMATAKDLPLWLGIVMLSLYFTLGVILPRIFFTAFYKQLGLVRYLITVFFVLSMFGVFGKMALSLLFNIKYIIHTPWFNI
ncbi:MAG: hypothetical protein ACUZ77_00705 [Candidatus Brocadiales bacterium]